MIHAVLLLSINVDCVRKRLCLSCCLFLLYTNMSSSPSLSPPPPSKNRLSSSMNPIYSPVQPGAPYGNPKNMAYTGETHTYITLLPYTNQHPLIKPT